jgi:hypothetical protein
MIVFDALQEILAHRFLQQVTWSKGFHFVNY